MSSWGSLLLGPKKLQNQQFYIIDWIREKTPGRCCQSGYLLLWWLWCTIGGLGTLRKCYVSSPVAKALVLDWKSWLAHNCFWMSSWGSPLLGPKKLQNQQFYIIDWIRKKNSWSKLPIWLLAAMMIMMYYWRFWEPCANAMLVVLLPKLWFWIENHDWHKCSWMSSWGSLLLGPKKLQNQQFYIIDWIRKKLLVDAANLATCCHDDCDVLLEVWEPCANAMLVVLLPKLWFWIENHDWHKCSWMSSWGLTLTGPKKASKSTILYNRLNKEKNSWSMLPIWLLAAMMIVMYYWRFGNPARALAERLWDQGDY